MKRNTNGSIEFNKGKGMEFRWRNEKEWGLDKEV